MADLGLHAWDYLELLPGTDFYRIYKNPTAALGIFRKCLSNLAKSFVMFMLYTREPMRVLDLDIMVNTHSAKEKEHALDLLKRYHIFVETNVTSAKAYKLTENFARSLRQALEGSGDVAAFGEVSTDVEATSITVTDLDNFARQQWEGILGFMVGSSAVPMDEDGNKIGEPSDGVVKLLEAGHLIELSGTGSRGYTTKITKEGFAFVLQDVNIQVWTLLFQYVDMANEALGIPNVDVISFLFLVSSMELGLAYTTASLTDTQRRILIDLQGLGILYIPYQDDESLADYFYPTRLATILTADSDSSLQSTARAIGSSLASPSNTSTSTTGFIILETNFRLYAYTSSSLQIALLALFTNLKSRHPNLVTAKMTKSSVQRAVQAGITADQIVSYLSSHAHPQMRRHAQKAQSSLTNSASPTAVPQVLPATVIDQIHLWQLERDRMTTTSGFLIKEFGSEGEYKTTKTYADEISVLVWHNDRKRMIFVNKIEGVREFMKDRRERELARADG